jgi:transposase
MRVKSFDSHAIKALLTSRGLPVKMKRDLENQIRGLLKNLGLVIGRATFNAFAVRAEALIANRAERSVAVEPLIKARKVIEEEIGNLDPKVMKLARHDR